MRSLLGLMILFCALTTLAADKYIVYSLLNGKVCGIGNTLVTTNGTASVDNTRWYNTNWYSSHGIDSTTNTVPTGLSNISQISNRVSIYPAIFDTNSFRAEVKNYLTNTVASIMYTNNVITNMNQMVISGNTPNLMYGFLNDLRRTNNVEAINIGVQYNWYNKGIKAHGGWGNW